MSKITSKSRFVTFKFISTVSQKRSLIENFKYFKHKVWKTSKLKSMYNNLNL